jgi:hypothetical protein
MTEVVVRQSGKRGTGFALAMIMLAVLGFYRWGTSGGRSEPRFERTQDPTERARELLDQNKDLESLRGAFSREGNAAQKLLESLPKSSPRIKGEGQLLEQNSISE